MKTKVFISFFIFFAMSSRAQEVTIRQMYQTILTQSSGDDPKTRELLDNEVNEVTVRALPQSEINAILPLARQCLQSPKVQVRKDGLIFFIAVVLRYDSAKLLEPYIDDLGKILDEDEDTASLRHATLFILGSMLLKLPDKAIALLVANLESSRNSDEEVTTIAVSLIEAAPADASILHKVLSFTTGRPDSLLTSGVLRQLGLSRCRLPEAMDFISLNLNQGDHASAVDAVSMLDRDKRALFSSQLQRIASDPAETQHVRQEATEAIKP